jgi:hypothetical protein
LAERTQAEPKQGLELQALVPSQDMPKDISQLASRALAANRCNFDFLSDGKEATRDTMPVSGKKTPSIG